MNPMRETDTASSNRLLQFHLEYSLSRRHGGTWTVWRDVPGCSACLGMNEDKIPAGKYCISTSNRNFEGRQGPNARTLLASPLTAAAAALTGEVSDVRNIF